MDRSSNHNNSEERKKKNTDIFHYISIECVWLRKGKMKQLKGKW